MVSEGLIGKGFDLEVEDEGGDLNSRRETALRFMKVNDGGDDTIAVQIYFLRGGYEVWKG